MTPTIWAFILLVLALAIVILELFVPSGGILGVLAACSLVASVVMVHREHGLNVAAVYLLVLVVSAPLFFTSAIKWWPRTPIGRRVLNLVPGREKEFAGTSMYDKTRSLVGRKGIATSVLMPSGAVRIEDRILDVVSEGIPIEKGDAVQVIHVEGPLIVVRRCEETPGKVTDPTDPSRTSESDLLMEDPFAEEPK
jgi:membrane-bound ClpP family serine protease